MHIISKHHMETHIIPPGRHNYTHHTKLEVWLISGSPWLVEAMLYVSQSGTRSPSSPGGFQREKQQQNHSTSNLSAQNCRQGTAQTRCRPRQVLLHCSASAASSVRSRRHADPSILPKNWRAEKFQCTPCHSKQVPSPLVDLVCCKTGRPRRHSPARS